MALHFLLKSLERGVDVTGGRAAGGFLAEHIPRFDRFAKLDANAGLRELAHEGETELEVRSEPPRPSHS